MAKLSRPRFGSLQFWPRKRAERFIPSVNWDVVKGDNILGFIAYKAGMATATVKDSTPKSMTMGKKLAVPITLLEVPPMKIYSVRFYKNGKVSTEVVVSHEPILKRVVRVPKQSNPSAIDKIKDFDDVRVIVYSLVSETSVKKTPDMIEVGVGGKDKIATVKSLIGKPLLMNELFKNDLVDVRGLTTGRGLVGPMERMGISLKGHKSEKGRRRPGSLGPWHPAHVTFRVPMAGQKGMFSRVHYNLKVLGTGPVLNNVYNLERPFKNYGVMRSNYILLHGSVQGPVKRQILITPAMRASKGQTRRKYELLGVQQ